jgi:hypothetical protein
MHVDAFSFNFGVAKRITHTGVFFPFKLLHILRVHSLSTTSKAMYMKELPTFFLNKWGFELLFTVDIRRWVPQPP